MKTCNGGYCDYKVQEGSRCLCRYEGYCDYQCPKDGRSLQIGIDPLPPYQQCTCGTTSKCPIHGH